MLFRSLHFSQVFKILELLGYPWAKDCIHVYHGLYLDKDGKKLATRKGKTIFMSSHNFEEIERTCDRTAIIKEGYLVAVEDMKILSQAKRKSYIIEE